MTVAERIAFHRRLAEEYGECHKLQAERQAVVYPEDWRFAEDAVLFASYFGGQNEIPIARFLRESNATMSDAGTMECRVFSSELPDFRAVDCASWPSESGFAMRSRYEGHTRDGTTLVVHLLDFIQMNEDGLISRWELYADGGEFGRLLELTIGVRGPFENISDYLTLLMSRTNPGPRQDGIAWPMRSPLLFRNAAETAR